MYRGFSRSGSSGNVNINGKNSRHGLQSRLCRSFPTSQRYAGVSSTWLLSVLARILCCATWLVPRARRRSAEIRLAGLIRLTFFLWRLSSAVAASALWLKALQPSACLLGASSLARPLWPLPTQAAPPPYRPWLLCLREKSNPKRKPSASSPQSSPHSCNVTNSGVQRPP